jgi:hypothetical protein
MHDQQMHVSFVGKSKLHKGGDLLQHSWGGDVLPLEHSANPKARARRGIARSSAEQLYFQASCPQVAGTRVRCLC